MNIFDRSRGRRRIGFCLSVAVTLVLILGAVAAGAENKDIFLGFTADEESETVPAGWEHIGYFGKAKNTISLVTEGKRTVVHMKSLNSISSHVKRPDVRITEYPILTWRWKIDRAVGMAIEDRRDRNDCAARIRIIFGREQKGDPINIPAVKEVMKRMGFTMPRLEPPGMKIDYVWGNSAKKGAVIDYPGARNHKVVVVERGNDKAGTWIWEKRNIREDFRRFFGLEPPGIIAIAVLTDTDQTNEGVEADYSSIVLLGQ